MTGATNYKKLFIGNLPEGYDEQRLTKLFSGHCNPDSIDNVRIVPKNGRFLCFMEFHTEEATKNVYYFLKDVPGFESIEYGLYDSRDDMYRINARFHTQKILTPGAHMSYSSGPIRNGRIVGRKRISPYYHQNGYDNRSVKQYPNKTYIRFRRSPIEDQQSRSCSRSRSPIRGRSISRSRSRSRSLSRSRSPIRSLSPVRDSPLDERRNEEAIEDGEEIEKETVKEKQTDKEKEAEKEFAVNCCYCPKCGSNVPFNIRISM